LDRAESPRRSHNRGVAHFSKGDYERAISDYDQAMQLDPNYAAAYNNRGNAYRQKGEYDRAISDYDQAIRLDPKYALAYSNRGEAYEAKNDSDHAIADFDQALKLNPSLAKGHQGLARVQGMLATRSSPGTQTNTPAR
jgi:tetratricopeptide (TPR) repeat protein